MWQEERKIIFCYSGIVVRHKILLTLFKKTNMNASTTKQPFITPKASRNMLLIILSFVLLSIVVWRLFDYKIEKIQQETITIKH